MGVLTVYPGMATTRAMTTETYAVTTVNSVALLTTPHALLWMASALFSDSVADRGADLLDPRGRERRGNVHGGVDMTLEASEGVSTGEAGQASIKGLSLYLKRLSELSHTLCQTVARLLVRAEVLDFAG